MKIKNIKHELPLVVVFGRTNVGKSTLFNTLAEIKQALVSDIPGTTRDSNFAIVEWRGFSFELVDTAGIMETLYIRDKKAKANDIDDQAQKQVKKHLDQASLVIFLVDAKTGPLPEDLALAKTLRRLEKYKQKTILVANKVDSLKIAPETAIFNKLGLGEPFLISAVSGLGTGDLLDKIINFIKPSGPEKSPDHKTDQFKIIDPDINLCLLGKPNVGKSSLINKFLGYQKIIISDTPHTTREPQDILISYQDKLIKLIDTAGISKKGKRSTGLERLGITKSLKSLEKAEIALLVLDLSEPLTQQDAKIAEEIISRQKSLIFIANKWDLIENRNTKEWTQNIYRHFPFATWAPIQFISAKTGEKINKIMDLVMELKENRHLNLSDSQADKFLKRVVKVHKPTKGKGIKAPRIYEFKQIKTNPPRFIVRIGADDNLHFSYLRFMENQLREQYSLLGTPLNIKIISNKKSHTTYT